VKFWLTVIVVELTLVTYEPLGKFDPVINIPVTILVAELTTNVFVPDAPPLARVGLTTAVVPVNCPVIQYVLAGKPPVIVPDTAPLLATLTVNVKLGVVPLILVIVAPVPTPVPLIGCPTANVPVCVPLVTIVNPFKVPELAVLVAIVPPLNTMPVANVPVIVPLIVNVVDEIVELVPFALVVIAYVTKYGPVPVIVGALAAAGIDTNVPTPGL
jgi:hypothetical protein